MSTTPARRRSQLSPERQALLEQQLRGVTNTDAGSKIEPLPADAPNTLSFAQQGMWFVNQLDPSAAHYNLPMAFRLDGGLNAEALQQALVEIVDRHEVLRTTIDAAADGTARPVVRPTAAFEVPLVDLSPLPIDEARAEAGRRIDNDAAQGFDVAADPPMRAFLLRLSADEHVLFVNVHHIAFDQWSSRVLQQELTALYIAYRDGSHSPLPPLPIQYADYAAWQRDRMGDQVLQEQIDYWRAQLSDLSPLQLPTDHPRTGEPGHSGTLYEFQIPAETSHRMRALSHDTGTSLFMVLLAAFQALLSRYCGHDDITVGTPIAGRLHHDTEPLIGLFINTLVLRSDLSGDPTFEELLHRVRNVALEAYANQDLPFAHLVDEIGRDRNGARTPLFDVLFSYQADAGRSAGPGLDELGACDFPITRTTTQFDLAVELMDADGRLYGAIEYSTDLFDPSTIERLACHLTTVLEGVAAAPGARLSEIPLLTADERASLESWARGPEVPVPDRPVHELIADLAARHPRAVAVTAADQQLTYGRLDDQANRLAHLLRGQGAGPGTIVAVCLDRGPDLVTALLAIWKAGASYLPLAPDQPADRLAFQLADSGAHTVITAGPLQRLLPRGPAVLIDDPSLRQRLADLPATPPIGTVHPDEIAYLIYTSGSTGTPKAVSIRHGGLTNLITAQQHHFHLTPNDRILQFYSASFDASIWETTLALTAGATLITTTHTQRHSPQQL
ncbi:condensation domain-containing protein, partial [Actinomadura sp. 9N215]|uniref:non-ribosomal peptide synthetase n=1 Tax=Actinomadura sp. 9N215 TaxID=3375150 RepID=UPI0037955527